MVHKESAGQTGIVQLSPKKFTKREAYRIGWVKRWEERSAKLLADGPPRMLGPRKR